MFPKLPAQILFDIDASFKIVEMEVFSKVQTWNSSGSN